jgi:electron transport complex protein RnfD
MMQSKTLHISSSPHIRKGWSTDQIMKNVVFALLPVVVFSTYAFGFDALLVILAASTGCVLTEYWLGKSSNRSDTISDYSALITGILLGLTLPPSFPLWMAFCGGIIAITLGKYIFGGLGYNVFNPALVGRAFLQGAFPVAITTWKTPFTPERFEGLSSSVLTFPFAEPTYDAVSGATPLSAFKFDNTLTEVNDLLFGLTGGSAGETSAIFILIGGIYLAARKMMNWRIPVAVILSTVVLSGILHLIDNQIYPSPLFMIFSGGLMLGAVFMATDMVASPITWKGMVVYGAIIGILTTVIRVWGGLPEGVMYSILLANAISPHIDKMFKPKVYGYVKPLKQ